LRQFGFFLFSTPPRLRRDADRSADVRFRRASRPVSRAPLNELEPSMTSDLKGKAVIITGASTGIGAAAARAFARLGSKLVIHYNASREAAEAVASDCRASGAQTTLVGGDVTQSANVKRIAAEALSAYGRIDVLINNAGGLVGRTRIEDYTDEYLARIVALNITHVALFMHEVIPVMRRQKSGNVINVSSIAARHGGGGGAVLYAGAKGFISTATKGWAKEVAGDGIRVNAVSPGVITTPFHDRYSTAEQLKAMQSTIPMNRLGSADECAGTFVYLASDAMSGYVTGQVIEVNGGQYMP
jgi:3-oxoacyl-[acyl-carrier protein] reductase